MTFEIRAGSEGGDQLLLLFGRIRPEDLEELQRQIDNVSPVALDLREVTVVGRAVVAFLARCEANKVTLRRCPEYIREWIVRERSAGEMGSQDVAEWNVGTSPSSWRP